MQNSSYRFFLINNDVSIVSQNNSIFVLFVFFNIEIARIFFLNFVSNVRYCLSNWQNFHSKIDLIWKFSHLQFIFSMILSCFVIFDSNWIHQFCLFSFSIFDADYNDQLNSFEIFFLSSNSISFFMSTLHYQLQRIFAHVYSRKSNAFFVTIEFWISTINQINIVYRILFSSKMFKLIQRWRNHSHRRWNAFVASRFFEIMKNWNVCQYDKKFDFSFYFNKDYHWFSVDIALEYWFIFLKNRSSILFSFKKFIIEKNFLINDDSFVDEILFVHFNQFVNIVEHVIEFKFLDLNIFVVVESFNVSIFDFFVSAITRSFFVIISFAIYDDVYIIISTKNIISSFVFRFAIVISFAMSNRSYVIVSKNMIVDDESSQFSINLQSFTTHFFSKSSFTNRQRIQKIVFVVTNSKMRFDIEFSKSAMFDDIATNIFMFEKNFFVFDDIDILFSNFHFEFRSFKTSQSVARERDSKKNFISIDYIDCRSFDFAFRFNKFVMSSFTTDEIIVITKINCDFVNIDDSLFFFRFANYNSISSNFTSNILIDHENKFTFTIQFDHHLFDFFFAIFTFVTSNCSTNENTNDDHDNKNFIIFANDFHVFFNSIKFVFDRRSFVKSIAFKRRRLKSKKILLKIWKRLKRSITNNSTVYVNQNCREYINRRIFKEISIETMIANEFFDTRRTICKHENIDYTFSFIDMFKEEIDIKYDINCWNHLINR